MIFFLVILLLAVGPEKLPTFMRTLGKGMRQVRNASREFKDAIGLDELMREGDPFRSPPLRPPRARPTPVEAKKPNQEDEVQEPASTAAPPVPPPSEAAQSVQQAPSDDKPAEVASDSEAASEPPPPAKTNYP
jgi:sec-independent protein translocase protein TatB